MSAEISYQGFEAGAGGFVNATSPANAGTFAQTVTGAITGSHAYGESTLVDGDIAIYGTAVPNDVCFQFSQPVLLGGGGRSLIQPIIRSSDGNGTNCYVVDIVLSTGAITLYEKTATTFTPVSWTTGGTFSPISSGNVAVKAEAQGSTLRIKVWSLSGAEPGSFSGVATDSTHTSGKVGLRSAFGAGYSGQVASIDDAYIGDPGTTFPGPTTGTVTGSGTSNVGASETFTLNITGDGGGAKNWTGTPTLTLSGSAAGTITQFSAFAGTNTGTASILWTGAGSATVNATFPDSLAAGTAQAVTVSSAAPPTTLTLTATSGSANATVGTPINITATLNHPAGVGGVSLAEAASPSQGTFSPQPLVIAQGQLTGTFNFTPTVVGTPSLGGVAT